MIKTAILVIIMDIAQSVDYRNNIFLELMNMPRNALFVGKNVCMPHPPSVGAVIPWVAHPISNCDTCHTNGIYNKSTCHNITIPPASPCCIPGLPSCNLTSATPIMTDLLLPVTFPWCVENYAPASTPLREIPRERCSLVVERRTESHDTISHETLRNTLRCMIPPPTGTFWLCGTSVYNILPSQFNGRCTLVYWSRTLGALIPFYGVMQALHQVRSLSNSVQKLANDTALALGNISDTLASHKIMILRNRVALDYILATQGGACTIIGTECCTRLMDPTEDLNKIQQDILDHSAKLHHVTEDSSSWFGNLLGKPWLWIKEIANLLLFFLLVYYLCVHNIKCFIQHMTHAHHEETAVPTRKYHYP
ncbi:hypothetical protein IRJ41_015733 [Triplophysa rosa]|uniref:Uncharacterized protein n=1 Tax=Triplophysa rosa TaxID=992332 RepID=A0A9W7WTU2_TRIRA|nr:hypothetical protein IRJ41_015733 [Triplophysa rosa]